MSKSPTPIQYTQKFSLLKQTGILLTIISLLAVIGIGSSTIIIETTQGATSAVNIAGSLRMYAYKIASHMGQDQYKREIVIDKLEVLIHQFDNRLSHPNLVHILAEGENSRELPLN